MTALVILASLVLLGIVGLQVWTIVAVRRSPAQVAGGSSADTSPAGNLAPRWMVATAIIWVAVVIGLTVATTYVESFRICSTSSVVRPATSATERSSTSGSDPTGPSGTIAEKETTSQPATEVTTVCGGPSPMHVALLLLPVVLIFVLVLTSLDVLGIKLAFREVERKVEGQKEAVEHVAREVTLIRQSQTMSLTINHYLAAAAQVAVEGDAEVPEASITLEEVEG